MSQSTSHGSQAQVQQLQAEVARLAAEAEQVHQLQRQLRMVEARRASYVANTPLAIIQWDKQFRVVEWNTAAERIFGYTADEALGRHGAELLVPADVRPHVTSVFNSLLAQSGGTRSTNENIAKDGRRILCEWYNTPAVDDQGQVTGVYSLAQDVTEQQATARTLSESEAMLRSLVENAPDVIVLLDRKANITYSNRYGPNYTRAGVIGHCVYDMVIPEHRPIIQEAVEKVLATGEPVDYEVQEVLNRRWFHARLAPVAEEGEVHSLVIICYDIHDRKLQEEALRRSEEMFRVLAQNVPGVVYLCRNDARYSMLYLNDAVERLIGIPASEFLADRASFVELYHPDDAAAIPHVVDSAVLRRAPYRLVYRLRHAQGRWIWVEEYGQGVYDAQGNLRFLEGTVFDITQKRQGEEALRRSKEDLEHEVQARTQQLQAANRRLHEDFKKQEELTRKARESEEKFRAVCEDNPGPVAISRLSDGQILYANERLGEVLGVPRDELLGRSVRDFHFDPADEQPLRELLERHGQVRDFELRLKHRNGSLLWTIVSMRRIELASVPAALAILLDITERKSRTDERERERRMLKRMLYVHERDRQLVAYEIHDGIVQDMTGAVLHLQGAASKLLRNTAAAREDLQKGIRVLQECIDEARRLIEGLRPGVLEEQGVIPAVRYLAQQTEEQHGIKVELREDVRFHRLAPAVEMAIFRIVQEALANVIKHSRSPRARVVLSQREDGLVLKISDWGVGFDPKLANTRRYGLTGIRDRARLLGGEALIRSQPGQGTRLRIKLPLTDVLLPEAWRQPEVELGDEDSSSGWREMQADGSDFGGSDSGSGR